MIHLRQLHAGLVRIRRGVKQGGGDGELCFASFVCLSYWSHVSPVLVVDCRSVVGQSLRWVPSRLGGMELLNRQSFVRSCSMA